MKRAYQILTIVMILVSLHRVARGQDTSAVAHEKYLHDLLDSLGKEIPGLHETSEIKLIDVPLSDYIRSIGKVHHINVFIDDEFDASVTNSISDEIVMNILVFLCKKFHLTIETTGTILHFKEYTPPKIIPKAVPRRLPKITFDHDKVEFDLKEDSLEVVIRQLSRISGRRIIRRPDVTKLLTGFIPLSSFDDALESLLFMNGLSLQIHPKGFYIISNPGEKGELETFKEPRSYSLEVYNDTGKTMIFIKAEAVATNEIVLDVLDAIGEEYFIYNQVAGNSTLNLEAVTIDELFERLFAGTDYTFSNDGGIYLVGNRSGKEMKDVSVINIKYRPTQKVIDLLPSALKSNVELKEFVELNKIIVSGAPDNIRNIKEFILEIDRPVPMVKIEMMVVDVNFEKLFKAGIRAGLLAPGDTISAAKSILPGIDFSLSGTEINSIVRGSQIPMLANLGMLKSNFYLSIQAHEQRGNLKVITRPVISTLNGNPASISIGETRTYLLETQQFSNGAVNSFNQVTQRFERVEINTTLKVNPFVSHDGMVTLSVSPNFMAPGAQVSPNLPPDINSRQFESTIRMRDGETVVLGGLSVESSSFSHSGLPLLSRIPILKWFFGNSSKNKNRSSLIIYITPTITYN